MASKVVLITGANTGIGFQIVRALCSSDQEYNIIVTGRSLPKTEEAASIAKREYPSSRSNVFALQVDIERDESIQHAFSHVQAKFGRLDILVNNAGIYTTHQDKR
jgi:NAD(P)-dependent dehydrogenase (short-subunit alcohol dehydrogenase family)